MSTTQSSITQRVLEATDEGRLVETACRLVSVPSPTGSEQAMAEAMRAEMAEIGLQIDWQDVEDGRPNVLGIWEGSGDGRSLMFNGHMDTSYRGDEPELGGKIGFRPEGVVKDGRIYGLGISNMKGALACYLEAARAVRDAGVELQGTLMIAAVVGEIEKTQWGEEFRGGWYRGYATGSRHLPSHGGMTDMCILGEPTEQRIMLGHCGAMWCRVSTAGPFIHTAFSEGRLNENAILRLTDVLGAVREWMTGWEREGEYAGMKGVVNIGAIRGGYPWRVSRTPGRADLFLDVRVPPTMSMQHARSRFMALVRELKARFPDYGITSEVYITAPGAEIAADHPLIDAIDAGHREVFGEAPKRDHVRYFSDASALTRYGIQTVNYGTSSGLPGEDGENLDIAGLLAIARVYSLVIANICGGSQ